MTWKFWTWFKKKPIEKIAKEETKIGFSCPPPPKRISPISECVNKESTKTVSNSSSASENKTVAVHEDSGINVTDLLLYDMISNGMRSGNHESSHDNEKYGGGSCGGGGSSRSWNTDDDDTKRCSFSSSDNNDSYFSSYDSGSSCDSLSSDSGSDW